MGVTVEEVVFAYPAPSAGAISTRVAERTGLPVTVAEDSPDDRRDLYDLRADLAFAAHPKSPVQVTAYRPGAVRNHLRRTGMDRSPLARVVQGANEADGTQTVHVRGYVGQEPTLFVAVTLALESLGGRCSRPVSDDWQRDYAGPVSADELARRVRRVERQGKLTLAMFVLLLPVLIPMGVVSIAWHVFRMPWRLQKALRADGPWRKR